MLHDTGQQYSHTSFGRPYFKQHDEKWQWVNSVAFYRAKMPLQKRAGRTAAVLAIGTATPVNCMLQNEYADWYFKVTKSNHLSDLKEKMKKICDKSGIQKRYFYHTEQLLDEHPDFVDGALPSLDARLEIAASALAKLAAAAASKAITEWGRPASDITHLIVSTYSGAHMPGADIHLASLLGLHPSVKRTMLYYQGCYAASSALRIAKDIAENNRGARVLVACAEVTLIFFRAPDEVHHDSLVFQALFGDGAGAVIVGSDPDNTTERPQFEMVSVAQAIIPNTEHAVNMKLSTNGLYYRLSKEVPSLIANNIGKCLADAFEPLRRFDDWNELFWVVHPGGRAILDGFEVSLNLDQSKLTSSRRVLSEYGNLSGVSTIFVLDEMRSNREGEDGRVTGKGSELGAMVSFGPGLTVEMMLLRAVGHKICRINGD